MKPSILPQGEKYLRNRRFHRRWQKVLLLLGSAVVFCTTYALILPAITMERGCQIPEHTHSDACYTQIAVAHKTLPTCTPETLGLHQHTAACRGEDGELICGYADFVVHVHDSACYDEEGHLWCPLPKIEEHRHNEACYAPVEPHTHNESCYTQERGELICQLHEHSDSCWTDTEVLVCGLEETPGHQHDDSCLTVTESLICGLEESDGHQHTDACRDEDGELVCGTEESAGHHHSSHCFTQHTEITCGLAESTGHQHSEACYQPSRELICGSDSDHRHTDECYSMVDVLTCEKEETTEDTPAEPICGKKEAILHRHTESCFNEDGALVCGQFQVLAHQHGDACFTEEDVPVDSGILTCTIPEGEGAHTHSAECYDENNVLICRHEETIGHQHTDRCYGNWELTCGLEEHIHTNDCTSAGLTEEEQGQVDAVIALIDALPAQEEIAEKQASFEKAEDEEGYNAYLTEMIDQARAAYEAYEALTEEQKLAVTNADKLMELESLWAVQTLENIDKLTGDAAFVSSISVTSIADGTGPFDSDDEAGNDSSAENKIVRTFDTVTYQFEVQMDAYESNSFSEARVKLEFVLPLTAEQAVFDQTAMAWMDQSEGYAPVLTTETRTVDGVDTACQVLTCYKWLLPSACHQSVVPGTFGENVTINVKSMKNGDTFAPLFSAAMEYGTWDGTCTEHLQEEKASVTVDKITVSAAPKYNVRIGCDSTYKSSFDFYSGNEIAKSYGDGYGKGQVTGRVVKYGIVVQLYNSNASRGLKGIELPDGSDITFDLKVSSEFTINQPNAGNGYAQGQKVSTTSEYLPLLWSCDANIPTASGYTNRDGRVLYESNGCSQNRAPYANATMGTRNNSCFESGTWTATQDGDTIHITVSGYQINVDHMPTTNADDGIGTTGAYGVDLGIGCFSAGELWLVQPYNKIGETSDNQGPVFDVVSEYGQGKFDTSAHAINMRAKTISGTEFEDPAGTSNAQTRTDDDWAGAGVELVLPGSLQNRVAYARVGNYNLGVGSNNYRDGLDFATIGTEIRLLGGFSYNHRNEEENLLYWGTNLIKFYGGAIEVLDRTGVNPILINGAHAKEAMFLYATKKDGTDWVSDDELLHTYEDDLIFYKNLSDIPAGHLCVGMLYCFKEDTFGDIGEPYYFFNVPAKIRDNMALAGNAYMLASTSRVWTKSMFESAGMRLDQIPDWTDPGTKLSSFPKNYYYSANINGSAWYIKTDYSQAAGGIVKDHNSDWRHWGDTLLVIGYKAGITKNMCQISDSVEKNTYNLDAEQRVVDFRLQPRTYYDQGDGKNSLTTTVTITDTLPKYLTYRPGSAYFGGTYTQTSVNGGTQGTITGGTLREPDSVTGNADGTQTLVWTIPDVTVGEAMPAIYYSADIGDRNNPVEDVATGTTNLVNTVRISATHDLRLPTLANGNYAEAGIAVTRGTASSFGKYSKQKLVEPDGVIDYVAYFDNNSASSADVVLLDTMPYSGENGSHFNGTYTLNSWKLDVSKCDVSKLSLYYTMDEQYKDKTTASMGGNDTAKTIISSWTTAGIAADGTVTDLKGKRPAAWALVGTLSANQRIEVNMQIQLQPTQSAAGAEIENNYYVNVVSSGETEIHVDNPTVNRSLEGLTWLDSNTDGLQDTGEEHLSGVKVSLWKLKNGGNPDSESDYEPFCYSGTATQMMLRTGQKVSYLAGENRITVYEAGRYLFTDLPAGTYAVKFTHGDETPGISGLIASPANRGGIQEDHRDSDGIPT